MYLLEFRFSIFHDGKAWYIIDSLVICFHFDSICEVLTCLHFAFRALVIIFFIHLLVLFYQHGIIIHGLVWHFLFEVRLFDCMIVEHIPKYSSLNGMLFHSLFIITYWGITPSLSSSDLSHASLPLDLVVDLAGCLLGHTLLFEIIRPSVDCITFLPCCRSLWVIILGHIPSYRVCLHRYFSYHLVLSHLIRSSSCQFNLFLAIDYAYIDQSFSCQFEFGTAPISIGHLPCQFEYSESHLYWSVICLVNFS